ncbi:Set6p [Rhodotorula paludigena]|uniref:Set6p n=1 Tax=Rhodotorula paludigena TaxID=86838 RepID=UPI00317DF3E5
MHNCSPAVTQILAENVIKELGGQAAYDKASQSQLDAAVDKVRQRFAQALLLNSPMAANIDELEDELNEEQAAQEADRTTAPTKPTPRKRSEVLDWAQRMRGMSFEERMSLDTRCLRFTGRPMHSSNRSLDQLKPIRLKDMLITKTHKGRYLLLRTVARPHMKQFALRLAVEDESGRAEVLGAERYFPTTMDTGVELDALFPIGTVLAVREPTYKRLTHGPSLAQIRVYSPADIELLRPGSSLYRSAQWSTPSPAMPAPPALRRPEVGEDWISDPEYEGLVRIKQCGDALADATEPEESLFFALHRAQAAWEEDLFASAYRDANAVLAYLDMGVKGEANDRTNARLLRARSLAGMQLIKRAFDAFTELEDDNEIIDEGDFSIRDECREQIDESRTGEYPWDMLEEQDHDFADTEESVDHGDFVGSIEIATFPGAGRGVRATCDIEPGTLLLVEKAFRYAYTDECRERGYDFRTNLTTDASRVHLATAVIERLMDDPSTAPLLYALSGGEKYPPTGEMRLAPMEDRHVSEFLVAPAFIDVERIEAIIGVNAFPLECGATGVRRPVANDELEGSVLFLGASAFNHSCVPNASWRCYGNLMVVRSRAHIKKGEQIFIAYATPEGPPEWPERVLKSHFGEAGCPCPACDSRRRDPPAQLRRRLELSDKSAVIGAPKLYGPNVPAFNANEARRLYVLAEQLEKTYARDHVALRPLLIEPYYACMIAANAPSDSARKVDYLVKCIGAMGGELRIEGDAVKVVTAPLVYLDLVQPAILHVVAHFLARGKAPAHRAAAKKWLLVGVDIAHIQHSDEITAYIARYNAEINKLNLMSFAEEVEEEEA